MSFEANSLKGMQLELHIEAKREGLEPMQIYINSRNNENPFSHVPGAFGTERGDSLTGSFFRGAVGDFDGVGT